MSRDAIRRLRTAFAGTACAVCLLVLMGALARAEEPTLAFDFPPGTLLPKDFRLADGGADAKRPDIGLRISGSSEFDPKGLDQLAAALPRPLVIVDLRQESHGFLGDIPVVWFAPKDQGNFGKTPAQAAADEAARLAELRSRQNAQVTLIIKKDKDGGIKKSQTESVPSDAVSSEADLAAARGLGYLRLFVTDDMAPDVEQVDRFIAALRGATRNTWFHVHCHAGHGRTTTFMVMYALLYNDEDKSLKRIVAEQAALGGADLLNNPKTGWQKDLYLARAAFLRDFAAYAAHNPAGLPLTYGQWRAASQGTAQSQNPS